MRTLLVLACFCITALAEKCTDSDFEAPHFEWEPVCVARFLGHIGLKHKSAAFVANNIAGNELKDLNATALEGLNITKASEQQSFLENVARLERHNPTDNGESILYLPLMLAGTFAFVYIMFLKGSDFERSLLRNLRRITKKANAGRDGGALDADWLEGTAAAIGQGSARKRRGSKK
eukprot:TRINITY_DN8463_c0_g1_i2.p1 TRINITY_DN8463_c0_g1~~TRINITY_DN8463_c0_g1_i2.p1  ORF type:complete len:177 (+),score=36.78 TRINITY_DN8463_c0_g1_i2:234-764(+)